MARPFLKRRESIARKNLELCFPQHSAEEREKMIAENFRSLGMALVETGMAWFWPDSRVRKWFDVEGLDNLKRAQMQNRGVMVVGVHFMSLELGGRVMGLCQPMMATYRPHNKPEIKVRNRFPRCTATAIATKKPMVARSPNGST